MIVLAALLSVISSAAGAGDVASRIADDLAKLRVEGFLTIAGETVCAERNVATFYARRGNQPAWNPASVDSLLRAVRDARNDGLNPRDYHLAAIESFRKSDPETLAERDILCSDAFLLLGLHLSQGRVNPVSLNRDWCIPPRKIDLPAALESAIDSGDPGAVLEQLAPHRRQYLRLRDALAAYRAVEQSGGWPSLSIGPPLRLGDRGPRVVELRRRLAREPLGTGPSEFPALDPAEDTFDADLEAVVLHFQSHHGLEQDGIVGGATRRALNVPAAERVEQIRVNMERWRWMPDQLGDSYVQVNIAAFRLDVMEKEDDVVSMKAVVGKDFWETPFFPANITEIVLNPSWYVPEKIADEELRPNERRNPRYYEEQHIEVLPNGRLRQLPGPWNALGRIKFNMPNPFSVYLHDTPEKELFSQPRRAFSHGCIRLERPLDLALYLLGDQSEWNAASIEAAIATGAESVIPLTRPEPVYVLYWTAWAARDGHVDFHDDVYQRDDRLARALVAPVTPGL